MSPAAAREDWTHDRSCSCVSLQHATKRYGSLITDAKRIDGGTGMPGMKTQGSVYIEVIADLVVTGFDVNGEESADLLRRLHNGTQTLCIDLFALTGNLFITKTWVWHLRHSSN